MLKELSEVYNDKDLLPFVDDLQYKYQLKEM